MLTTYSSSLIKSSSKERQHTFGSPMSSCVGKRDMENQGKGRHVTCLPAGTSILPVLFPHFLGLNLTSLQSRPSTTFPERHSLTAHLQVPLPNPPSYSLPCLPTNFLLGSYYELQLFWFVCEIGFGQSSSLECVLPESRTKADLSNANLCNSGT